MQTTLSIIAIIISSMALIGVAVGLTLQGRQLRASQIQLTREMHLEVTKLAIANPEIAGSIYGGIDSSDVPRASFLNFSMQMLRTGYSTKTLSVTIIEFQIADLLSSEYARNWWKTVARAAYENEATTKSERRFFAIVERVFDTLTQATLSGIQAEVDPLREAE